MQLNCLSKARQNMSDNPALESHCSRVALIALESAKILHLPNPEEIATGAYLHDLGKTTWPPDLFRKYPLDSCDWNIIYSHPVISENIAVKLWPDISKRVKMIIRGHHERPGGKGYPDRLSEPCVEMLLVAACDAFDAMTNRREYRPATIMLAEEALMEIAQFATAKIVAAIAATIMRKV